MSDSNNLPLANQIEAMENQPCNPVDHLSYQIVDGLRRGSKLYEVDSFLFYKSKQRNHSITLVCQMRTKTGCPASGILKMANDKVKLTCSNHNHSSEAHEKDIRAFKSKLKERSKNSPKSTRVIFDEVCREFSPSVSSKVSFPGVQRSMYNFKSERYLRLPTSVADFTQLLSSETLNTKSVGFTKETKTLLLHSTKKTSETSEDKESRRTSSNILKFKPPKQHQSIVEMSLFKAQEEYQEYQLHHQQQDIVRLTESVKSALQRPPNKVLEQLQYVDQESRNEKLLKQMLYQMTPQIQSKPQQKTNISAALGKPANTERSRKSPLNTASISHSALALNTIEIENTSPPPTKKAREIHIDLDVSDEEPTVVSESLLQPTIEPPVRKSVNTPVKHKPVLDINAPQKRILVVPNHQQSVMSNLSSLWKAGRLCDAFIGNGTVNLKVHKMILGAVCPKVLDLFYTTPQHKLPKVTFPSSVSKEALLAFAEYMYNGVLDLDPNLLAQLKIIAQQLDMKDFEQLCKNQLKSSLVPNMLPTLVEPMLNEPCTSSGLIQPSSPEDNQTFLNTISTAANNCNNTDAVSNLPLLEVRAETDDNLMEVVNNNLTLSSANNNICDINANNRPQVKIENVDPEADGQYGRETVSSSIHFSISDSIVTSKFNHFSNTDLSQSSSTATSTSQHINNTRNKSLPVGHVWKQNNKDKVNIAEELDPNNPYPIGLFTANWANVPLIAQDIKKEYNVG